jgi:GT2 family glycosyltransferase
MTEHASVRSLRSLPRVTVVVLTYCNEDEAAACIESLQRMEYPALDILLVDNNSPDGSGERLRDRYPTINYLQSGTNGGYTAGNNRGIEWALAHGAEYLLILNDDTELDPDCVTHLVNAAAETGVAAVAPLIVYYDEPDVVWYAGGSFSPIKAVGNHWHENEPVPREQERRPITFVCGCCFLIRADVIRAVGGFDESYFTYVEDTEMSVRLARSGYSMLYEPKARVLHRIGRAAPATPNQIRLRDRNRRRLVARHFTAGERIRFALWFYPTRIIHWLRYIVTGDREREKALRAGVFHSIT